VRAEMSIDKEKMDSIFKPLKKSLPVAILVQYSPDPDCIGAAAGFSLLLKEVYGLKSNIFHHGKVSHPQNKSMKNILHISMKDGSEFSRKKTSATVVLDTDLTSTGFLSDELTSVDVRIDHHSMDRDNEPQLEDIRPVGSTCSIVWEYLSEFGISLEGHADTATAMLLGIKTDTVDFTSASTSELDITAHRSLLSFVNQDSLARVTNFQLPVILFELEALAFAKKDIRGTKLVSFIGDVKETNRDVIPTIADRFVRMEGISTAVIMGMIDSNIVASIRSTDNQVDVADLCERVFGKDYSGAKEGCGGAKVPLGPVYEMLSGVNTKGSVVDEVVLNYTVRIFEEEI